MADVALKSFGAPRRIKVRGLACSFPLPWLQSYAAARLWQASNSGGSEVAHLLLFSHGYLVDFSANRKELIMKQHYLSRFTALTAFALIMASSPAGKAAAGDTPAGAPLHISLTAGWLDYEGDEAVNDTFIPSVHLGYDLTENWTLEGILTVAPDVRENFRHSYGAKISRLEENAGAGIHDTSSAGLALEGLYHFDRSKMVDPYLAVGAGLVRYEDDFDSQYEPEIRAGAGILWHLTSQWAIRTDARVILAGTDPEFNSSLTAGITWTPFAASTVGRSSAGSTAVIPVAPVVKPVEAPSTEKAPAEKAENVKKYELHIEFAENSSDITAQYYGELDVIGRELRDQPKAKAKIEAHVDQRKNSVEKDAVKLTEKRAKAVQDYLLSHWKVRKSRTEAVGYGFSNPKEKADLDNGNLANRRIEISIIPPAGKSNPADK